MVFAIFFFLLKIAKMVLPVVRTEGQNDICFLSAKRTAPYSFLGTKGSPLKISYPVANSK